MTRVTALISILLASGLIGLIPTAAQTSERTAAGERVAHAMQLAERTIVCGPRRGCWQLREGCRLVVAPHPRNNRVRCTPTSVRPA
jgi:hypothetical protein